MFDLWLHIFDLFCSLNVLAVSVYLTLMTASKHVQFFSKKIITDDWPHIAKLDWFTKRIRKLPRKVKMILLGVWVCFTFCLFDSKYSGIQNYLNHAFACMAASIEMEALYSLQFYKPKHNHIFQIQ